MIKIVVDGTADTPPDLCAAYNITVVPLLVQFGRETLRDGVDISRDEFFRRLAESDELPRTSAPAIGMFEETFRQLTSDGSEVLVITLASKLSGTFNAARQAAQLVEPARVVCFDSETIAMPLTYMAVAAAEAAQAGRSIEQIVQLLEELPRRMVVYVALDTLRYLEKGGRIGRMRALLGTMLSVKPILEVRDAEVQPVEQVRTWKRVPPRMVELMQARGPLDELSVLYTAGFDNAELLADLCAQAGLMPRERIRITQVGAVLGTHVGPGAVGLTAMLRKPA